MKDIPVKQIMTDKVISVQPKALLTDVAEIFEANRIHHIPVVDNRGMAVGMISRLDYYKLQDHFSLFLCDSAEERNRKFFSSLLASEVMSKNIVTISADAPVSAAVEIFLENLFHALPVTSDGKLVGIVTDYDVLKYMYDRDKTAALSASGSGQ